MTDDNIKDIETGESGDYATGFLLYYLYFQTH